MTPKVKEPPRPKLPQSPLDTAVAPTQERTSSAYRSLVSTTPTGLVRKASTAKKTLLGGVR
jgi:hypothetical protein